MEWNVLTSAEAASSVASEWQALQERSGRSIFTGYAWFECWCRHIGEASGAGLYIVTGRKDGRLVAIAPLSIRRSRGIRLLEWAAGAVGDYCDFLLETPDDAAAVWDYVRTHAPFDLAQIKEVHPDAACIKALRAFAKPVRTSRARRLRFDWPTFDAWIASLPYPLRKQYRARIKQTEAIGSLRYEVLRQGPVPEDAILAMVAQKTALLKARGRRGVFDAPGAVDFFRAIAEAEGKNGALHFSTLFCGDHAIALHLGFVFQGRFLSYMPSYDPAWSHISPGRLMLFRCIGWAMENGCTEFDYMRGEDRYKNSFSNDSRELQDFLFARTLRGRVAGFLHQHRAQPAASAAQSQQQQ